MKKIGLILFLSLFSFSYFLTTPVFAYKTLGGSQGALNNVTAPTGISRDSLQSTAGSFIKAALTLIGTIFLGLMIYGGFLWMTAKGDESQVEKAKNTIVAAIIGLIVIVAAYAITNIVTALISKTSSNTSENIGNSIEACNAQSEACNAQCVPLEGAAQNNCIDACDLASIQCTDSLRN